jgi:hypothetical protein
VLKLKLAGFDLKNLTAILPAIFGWEKSMQKNWGKKVGFDVVKTT